MLAQLLDMGFQEAAAREAAGRCGTIEAAIEWITEREGQAAASCSGVGSCIETPDIDECSICTESLLLADAAMRCAGHGGRRHYFHAHCLSAWVQECQRTGNGPTCPECRGPVQVRPRRLEEFLSEKGGKLDAEQREAFVSFREAAVSADGWSELRSDLWKNAGTIALVGAAVVGLGLAVAAGASAVARNRNRGNDEESRRR